MSEINEVRWATKGIERHPLRVGGDQEVARGISCTLGASRGIHGASFALRGYPGAPRGILSSLGDSRGN